MAEPEITASAEPEVISEPESEVTPIPEGEAFTQQEITIWMTFYVFWIVLIIALNIATIISLTQPGVINNKLSNMFLLSLIVARTAIAVLVMPARITGLFSNQFIGNTLCKLCHFCGYSSSGVSVFSTCGVAVSKYIEVKHPEINIPLKKGLLSIVIVWVVGFLYGIRAYFLNSLVLISTSIGAIWACTADPAMQAENQVFIFTDLILLFIIPLVLILVCYCSVLKVLNKKLHNKIFVMIKSSNQTENRKTGSGKPRDYDVTEETVNIKSIKMLIGVMAAFIVCYAAVYIWKLYVFFTGVNTFTSHFLTVEQIVYLISYSNPWINVFMYVYFRKDIRKHFCSACNKISRNKTDPLPESLPPKY